MNRVTTREEKGGSGRLLYSMSLCAPRTCPIPMVTPSSRRSPSRVRGDAAPVSPFTARPRSSRERHQPSPPSLLLLPPPPPSPPDSTRGRFRCLSVDAGVSSWCSGLVLLSLLLWPLLLLLPVTETVVVVAVGSQPVEDRWVEDGMRE